MIGRAPPAAGLEGRRFQNMRFASPDQLKEGVTRVFIEPGDEGDDLADAYKRAGVEVSRSVPKRGLEASAPTPAKAAKA